MKRYVSIFIWSLALVLLWAAGHDILSGERDLRFEYAYVLACLVLALAALVINIRKIISGGWF